MRDNLKRGGKTLLVSVDDIPGSLDLSSDSSVAELCPKNLSYYTAVSSLPNLIHMQALKINHPSKSPLSHTLQVFDSCETRLSRPSSPRMSEVELASLESLILDVERRHIQLQDEVTDSLNTITDRINRLETIHSDDISNLSNRMNTSITSTKYILTELVKRLLLCVKPRPTRPLTRSSTTRLNRINPRE